MINYPLIDPVLLNLGFIEIRWYGVMYLISSLVIWYVLSKKNKQIKIFKEDQLENLMFYGLLGVVVGGRLGYIFFYNFAVFIDDPLILFKIWLGGMSFHGGLIGVIVSIYFFANSNKIAPFKIYDEIALLVPISLGLGRIGNFINGELWGKITSNKLLGVYAPDNFGVWQLRHPSQLYEAFFEGLVLFIILWLIAKSKPPQKALAGFFLLFYGIFRFFVEFVRLPDAHIGYLYSDWFTLGQLLTLPMMILGLFLILIAYKKNATIS